MESVIIVVLSFVIVISICCFRLLCFVLVVVFVSGQMFFTISKHWHYGVCCFVEIVLNTFERLPRIL